MTTMKYCYDYGGIHPNEEIYMLDVYNELGNGYQPDVETLKKYTRHIFKNIFFLKIKIGRCKSNNRFIKMEIQSRIVKVAIAFETINNDIYNENEIMGTIGKSKNGKQI